MIINTDGNGYPIYLASTSYIGTQWFINYNNYYNVNGTNIGYAGGDRTTMAAWQGAVSTDLNSVNVYPVFLDITSNMLVLDTSGITCPRLPVVADDILDSLRTPITTMGAYHFEPFKRDIMPMEFLLPSSTVSTGQSTPISIRIYNLGLDTITSFMVAYEVNGIAGIPYSWNGSLAPQDTTSVQIGNFMPLAKGNSLKVYTYLPNGSKDQFTLNDTLSTEVFACDSVMHGMYSIGATGDFATIYEAIQAVEHCGISASVVFEIENGTYTQGLAIGAIQGVNDSTTITFTSQSRNASDVIINVGHTALRLIDAAHLNFEYITNYSCVIGVEFVETCENIEFYRCTLATNTSSDHSSYRAVNYANTSGSGHYLKDVRFIGNTISGGYYNMYLYYASSSTSDMSKC